MLRLFSVLSFIALSGLTFSQEISFVLKGQIFNAPSNQVELTQLMADNSPKVIATVPMDDKGNFEHKIKVAEKDYYSLKLSDGQAINLIIQNSDTIKVFGDGRSLFFNTNIINSEESSNMLDFMRISKVYGHKLDSANAYLMANKSMQREIQQSFSPIHQSFLGQRQQFIKENSNSPALLGAVSSINPEQEFAIYENVVQSLAKTFPESATVKLIVAQYEANKEMAKKKQPLGPGNEVPEIALPNPKGDTLRLSDYKGKVVLLDFWAAWCRPCRLENPNVVKMYEKYKDQGFEVFSVSLDKTQAAWEGAIEQDGLVWDGHVSDLAGWTSVAAKAYKVNSIPYTILLDKEGKVIGTNLRGQQLAQTLETIFE